MEIVTESLFCNQNDLIIGWEEWKPERGKNVAFITGLSGSGKTTLSREIGTNSTIVINLDAIETCTVTYRTEHIIKKLKSKFKWYNEKWYNSDNRYSDDMKYLILEIIDICQKNPNQLYIIEGIQLFQYFIPEFFIGKPIIIKGTSMVNSIIRDIRRNGNGDIKWSELESDFTRMVEWYMKQEKHLNKMRKKINR